jgi:hypothetical protein
MRLACKHEEQWEAIMKMHRGSFARLVGAVLTVLCVVLALPPTEARAAIITFLTVDQPDVNDGNVVYEGGETPLVGSIDVDFILATDTPLHSGASNALACFDCRLTFLTGNRLSIPSSPVLVFASGGTIAMVGTVPGAGIPTRQLLMAGEITGSSSLPSSAAIDVIPGAYVAAGVFAVFRDVKNVALADYFGLQGGGGQAWAGAFAIGLAGLENVQSGAFVTEVWGGGGPYGAAVLNVPIPEPQTWLLCGVGLAAITLRCRAARTRRNNARNSQDYARIPRKT